MKYEYINKRSEVYDVVLWEKLASEEHGIQKGKPYLVTAVRGDLIKVINDKGVATNYLGGVNRHTIKTKPGSEGKPGDMMIRVAASAEAFPRGSVTKVLPTGIHTKRLYYKANYSIPQDEVLILCAEPQLKRNLAFYKRSGEPWTQEEYYNLCNYVGDILGGRLVSESRKFIFDMGERTKCFLCSWIEQEDHTNFRSCEQVAYEDIFPKDEWIAIDRLPVVGDYVRAKINALAGDHPKGTIQQITKVVDDCDIYISSTNDSYWALGHTWELVEKRTPNGPYQEAPTAQDVTYTQPIPEEETMNTTLTLLIELMGGTVEVHKDVTNSDYIGIMTSDDKYLGYVYADTLEGLEAIVTMPENEGNTLHVFSYETSLTQKPIEVIRIERKD